MSVATGQVKRPSALGDDARRFGALTWTLAATDFKLRFFGSSLGYAWSLARPLLVFSVLYLVFTHVFKFGSGVKNYPAYLLMGLMLWNYFTESTGSAVMSLTGRENLLRVIRFPRLVVPFSVALTSLFNLGLNLVAVMVLILIYGIEPRWSWLEFPILLLFLVTFTTGIGMLLSALYVRFRDVAPIWEVFSTVMFYGTPVLYVITSMPAVAQPYEAGNPVALVMTQIRHAMLDPGAPSALDVWGWHVIFGVLLTAVVFALGAWVFHREAPRIAEHL
jgi:ABC-2 type transport system permease protein